MDHRGREPRGERGVDRRRDVGRQRRDGRRRRPRQVGLERLDLTPLRSALRRVAATLCGSWSTANTGAQPSPAAAMASTPAPQPRSANGPPGSMRAAAPGTSAWSGGRRCRTHPPPTRSRARGARRRPAGRRAADAEPAGDLPAAPSGGGARRGSSGTSSSLPASRGARRRLELLARRQRGLVLVEGSRRVPSPASRSWTPRGSSGTSASMRVLGGVGGHVTAMRSTVAGPYGSRWRAARQRRRPTPGSGQRSRPSRVDRRDRELAGSTSTPGGSSPMGSSSPRRDDRSYARPLESLDHGGQQRRPRPRGAWPRSRPGGRASIEERRPAQAASAQ